MADQPIRFYTNERLGNTRHLTPEGFLLCENVPIARTGVMQYAAGEVPLSPGPDRIIRVLRDARDVFDPVAIASFAGKPITNEHPPEKVTPQNWSQYALGVVLNPRRGDGVQFDNDFLYAELLFHDADAIREVLDGKDELSAGYDANYEQTRPGEGRQHNIIGNHVALVDRGRCGPRCAVGDQAMPKGATFKDRIMAAHRTGDEGALVSELAKIGEMMGEIVSDEMPGATGGGGEGHHVTVNLHGVSGVAKPTAMRPAQDDEPDVGTTGVAPTRTAPAGGGATEAGEGEPTLREVMERLQNIEEVLAQLLQDDGGEGEGGEGMDPMPEEDDAAWGAGDPGAVEGGGGGSMHDSRGRVRDSRRGFGPRIPGQPRRGARDDATETEEEKREREEREKREGRTGDRRRTTDTRAAVGDSASMRGAFHDMVARAEILVPGIQIPTFDSASAARMTHDAMCNFRRGALAQAWRNADARSAIEPLLAGKHPAFMDRAMTCDAITTIFAGASEMMRRDNNRGGLAATRPGGTSRHDSGGRATSPASINEANKKKFNIA